MEFTLIDTGIQVILSIEKSIEHKVDAINQIFLSFPKADDVLSEK